LKLKLFIYVAFVASLFMQNCTSDTNGPKESETPGENDILVDSKATDETVALYNNLLNISRSDKFIFGQEFPTDFRYQGGLNGDVNESDCKDIVGDHPGLHGSDFHYYLNKSDNEKSIHLNAAKQAYARGAVVTFDWHIVGQNSSTFYVQGNEMLFQDILQNKNGAQEWFYGETDKVISIIKSLGFPIVFRPLHEMNGKWFWWHSDNANDYKTFWRLFVDYLASKDVHNVIYCWSPNFAQNEDYFKYYPGDNYVDVLGIDAYEPGISMSHAELFTVMVQMVDYATLTGKIAAFTETGNRSSYPDQRPRFWTQDVLNPINGNAKVRQIAWVLAWINSNWGDPNSNVNPYIPYDGMDNSQAIGDFVNFYKDSHTLFENDLPEMYK
jgi:mannan endo-1,4-beta-mannosidase